MVSVLPGIATVIASYLLFREVSSVPIALLSALLMAVSQWHVTLSRWGWDAILTSFLQIVSHWLLIRSMNSGRKFHLILSGALMGVCLYTHITSWIALSIALSYLTFRAIRNWRVYPGSFRDFGYFVLPCLLVFAPLGIHYVNHPGDLVVRASEVNLKKAIERPRAIIRSGTTLVSMP